MHINEKNVATWLKVNGKNKPDNKTMQIARSLAYEPEFYENGIWHTQSASQPNVKHRQEVFFAGFDESQIHGLKLNVTCTCRATVECVHIIAVLRKYDSNFTYLYILFGLENTERFSYLWSRAKAVYARMEKFDQSDEIDRHYDAPESWDYSYTPELAA